MQQTQAPPIFVFMISLSVFSWGILDNQIEYKIKINCLRPCYLKQMQGGFPYLTTAARTQGIFTRVPPFSRKIGYKKT